MWDIAGSPASSQSFKGSGEADHLRTVADMWAPKGNPSSNTTPGKVPQPKQLKYADVRRKYQSSRREMLRERLNVVFPLLHER